jgi:hypothetical protein
MLQKKRFLQKKVPPVRHHGRCCWLVFLKQIQRRLEYDGVPSIVLQQLIDMGFQTAFLLDILILCKVFYVLQPHIQSNRDVR